MKNMNNANISESKKKKKDVFAEMVDAVFLFVHERYGDFSIILKDNEINYSQYAALMTIYMHESLSEGDLARMLFITPSTMSRMIYALEGKGWVKSTRDKADRRRVIVELSPAGKRRMEAMRDKQADVVARQVSSLGAESKEYVYQVAEFVNKALRLMISAEVGEDGEA
jgi:DNA-binding MarR family transcriptional regulator